MARFDAFCAKRAFDGACSGNRLRSGRTQCARRSVDVGRATRIRCAHRRKTGTLRTLTQCPTGLSCGECALFTPREFHHFGETVSPVWWCAIIKLVTANCCVPHHATMQQLVNTTPALKKRAKSIRGNALRPFGRRLLKTVNSCPAARKVSKKSATIFRPKTFTSDDGTKRKLKQGKGKARPSGGMPHRQICSKVDGRFLGTQLAWLGAETSSQSPVMDLPRRGPVGGLFVWRKYPQLQDVIKGCERGTCLVPRNLSNTAT